MDNKKASLNLDILVNGRFYRQLRYNGFYEVVDGEPVFDHLHVERFVEEKLPSLRTKNYSIISSKQRVGK